MGQSDIGQQPNEDEQQLPGVSLREAARTLGCSVDTVQRRLKSGVLKGEKRVRPNGTEEWSVYLPVDVKQIQVKRPAQPEDLVFPGPPDPKDLEIARLERIVTFLTRELESRRSEVSEAQRQSSLLIEREERRLALQQADAERAEAPESWWIRLGRGLGFIP